MKYEDWIRTKRPISQSFTVLKTQEEKCKFCKEYIVPCIIDLLTRDWSEVEIPPIEDYIWEVIPSYNKK